MRSRSHPPSPPVAADAAVRPGDPIDPVRALWGRRVFNLVLIGTLALYFGVAILAFGPNGAGLGTMNRLFGWDAPVLAMVPFLLLFWAPMFVLRMLPRRPERSFLCGAQDALDPTRNPDWRRPVVPDEVLARRMRRLRGGALLVAAVAATVAGIAYRLTSHQPPDAGKPLPPIAVAALGRGGTLPAHARIVAAVAGYDQAWIHAWSIRTTGYEDVYLPLRAPGQSPEAPVAAVVKATYIVGRETVAGDPPVAPFEGALAPASYPAWMRERMRAKGFVLASSAVELRRMRLDGREPGNDGVGAALAIGGGVVAVLFCLAVAGMATWRIPRTPKPGAKPASRPNKSAAKATPRRKKR